MLSGRNGVSTSMMNLYRNLDKDLFQWDFVLFSNYKKINNETSSENLTTPDDSTTEKPVEEPTVFEKIDLVNITRSDAETLIAKSGENVSTYGHDRMTKSLWLFGTQSAINTVKALIQSVDENVASAADTVHTYTAQNCTVDELMNRLQGVTYENVSFYQYDHSSITNSIIVYCDDTTWNNEVLPLLQKLDSASPDTATWIPVDNVDGNSQSISANRISIMKELYPETFSGVNFKYIYSETVQKTITYAYVTSDKATKMSNLLSTLNG